MPQRDLDVILYGASGFTGRQTVRYFTANAPPGLRWAIAGRNRAKLEQLHPGITAIEADSANQTLIDAMVARTRVMLSTAGPFAQYGDRLVDACVRLGTHYADITGETVWARSLIDRYHSIASAAGTRIIPFCGFDSVPSDLGAFAIARELNGAATEIKAYFEWKGGAPNGGTLASGWNAFDSGHDGQMQDLFLLSPESRHTASNLEVDPTTASFDRDANSWVVPFVMSSINTRVVRRSCQLLGAQFGYQEYSKASGPVAAHLAATGSRLLNSALRSDTMRSLLKRVTPQPGTGPSEKEMDEGWFRCHLFGRSADGKTARMLLSGDGDPANRITVKCLCESALALACDSERLPRRAGVLTPTTGLGEVLLDRLAKRGITIKPQ